MVCLTNKIFWLCLKVLNLANNLLNGGVMKKIIVMILGIASLTLGLIGSIFVYIGTNKNQPVATVATETTYAATADIKQVQTKLKKWGYYTGSVDGINGPQTIAAVKKFQKKYGLTQDGIVGPLTA